MINDRQHAKAERFRDLHLGTETFVMPCAWDAGSARMFEHLGFDCIGTTSGGVNWSAGRPDYVYLTPRHTMLAAYESVAMATTLPVSGDLEDGYGTQPDDVAETIRQSMEKGMVGGSIEDQTPGSEPGVLPLEMAVERIEAARQAADGFGSPYTLTARAESYFGGVDDPFRDAVDRANRYRAAGADCIFVPGPDDLETIARLVQEIDAPISVGIGSGGAKLSLASLADVGVRRVSTGGSIPRALLAVMEAAGREIIESGTFETAGRAMPETMVNELFG